MNSTKGRFSMHWRRSIKIKFTGRTGLIYEDDTHRRMSIFSEMLHGGDYDIVIYEESMESWLPPHDKESVTEEDRGLIKQNIEAWFKKRWFKPWRWRVDWQAPRTSFLDAITKLDNLK